MPRPPALALPEVFLGLIPGWGGAYLLPNLIGIENALEVVISNPLKQNRMLKPQQAFDLGIADAIFPAANFLEDSLQVGRRRAHRRDQGQAQERAGQDRARSSSGTIAIRWRAKMLESRIGTVPKSPVRRARPARRREERHEGRGLRRARTRRSPTSSRATSSAASIYAFNLVQKRAKRPAGAPDKALAKKVTKVGVIGAGLMASQFALLFVRRLQVPVRHHRPRPGARRQGRRLHPRRDRQARGEGPHRRATRRTACGRSSPARPTRPTSRTATGSSRPSSRSSASSSRCSPRSSSIIADDAILATNTSSLSVEEIGAKLAHPERLVGFHFFNPVAVMPLIEVVKTPQTTDAALSTALSSAENLGKNAVSPPTPPGFVVNRLLAKVMGEAARAVDEGTPFADGREGVRAARPADDAVPAHRPRRAEGRRARAGHAWRARSPTGSIAVGELPRARRATARSSRRTRGQGHRLDEGAREGRSRRRRLDPRERGRDPAPRAGRPRAARSRLMLDEGVVAARSRTSTSA